MGRGRERRGGEGKKGRGKEGGREWEKEDRKLNYREPKSIISPAILEIYRTQCQMRESVARANCLCFTFLAKFVLYNLSLGHGNTHPVRKCPTSCSRYSIYYTQSCLLCEILKGLYFRSTYKVLNNLIVYFSFFECFLENVFEIWGEKLWRWELIRTAVLA